MNTTLPRLDPKLLHPVATSLTSTKDHGGGGLQAHTGRKEKIITSGLETLHNLNTEVNFMKFNTDSQMLAICSNMKKSSLKLVHVPSFSMFSNWPPLNQALHHTNCRDFSPNGDFMALGNAAGKVLLYKLHHYHNA